MFSGHSSMQTLDSSQQLETVGLISLDSRNPEVPPTSSENHRLEQPDLTSGYQPLAHEFQNHLGWPRTESMPYDPPLPQEPSPSNHRGSSKLCASGDVIATSEEGNKEPKKEVCSNSRLSVLRDFVLFHLPAISITLALLALNVKELQWPYHHPTAGELSALQFAAKAHESLVVASLTEILMHRVRYGLLREDTGGISLGFLSSPLHLASPIRYLFSWELWGAVLNPTSSRPFHAVTGGLILLFIFVGIGASPFSAILMIPRLGWWEFSFVSMPESSEPYESYSYVTQSKDYPLYEMELRSASAPLTIFCMALAVERCHEQYLEPLLTTLLAFVARPPIVPEQQNITLSRYAGITADRPITFSSNNKSTIATSPMYFMSNPLILAARSLPSDLKSTDFLVRSQPDGVSKMENWKQPLVAVSCNATDKTPSLEDNIMSFGFYGSFHGDFKVDVDLERELMFLKDTLLEGNITYYRPDPIMLDIQSQIPVPISAAMLFLSNVTASKEKDRPGNVIQTQLCIVQARWMDADTWVTGQSLPAVLTDLGIPTTERETYLRRTSNRENVIKMHDGWLTEIGTAVTLGGTRNATMVNTAYRQARDACLLSVGYIYLCVPQFLAVYLTDALSLSYDSVTFGRQGDEQYNEPAGPQDIIIRHSYYSHIYAYSARNSTSVTVALAIFLLHVTIVILHTGVILLSPTPWLGSGWGSFGELIALALRSRTPKGLQNVGGGVSSSKTWKKAISVRELTDEYRLEMVVNNAQRGIIHGAGEVDGLITNVEPKVKYS
ncbi:uncharacterized protein FRV6_16624 [Fusarium oxysporum]|uniref:Uncharacterized protein n=1 Tax=Fusarium oxysporum TaxID=5507 RepID=A0A2H3UB40_FUSOX|nr:uncharacterized protein FRV6_16624 [Fusarium oxysporum]